MPRDKSIVHKNTRVSVQFLAASRGILFAIVSRLCPFLVFPRPIQSQFRFIEDRSAPSVRSKQALATSSYAQLARNFNANCHCSVSYQRAEMNFAIAHNGSVVCRVFQPTANSFEG